MAASAAIAATADKPTIGPPEPWVVPVTVPADDGKAPDTPIKLLLRDEQDDLRPGRIARYSESVYKVQTPQGLQAGAIAFAWDPDTQVPMVHKLQIHRGAQLIDVLASGQKFTVLRRETNLENAVLDGQLTASLQPEGLQVGDVIDIAMTIVTSDPAVGTHVEAAGASWNGIPVARAHFRAQWPTAVPMRIQADGGLVAPKVVRKDGLASIELSADAVQPLVLPKGAPMRYQYGRLLELSDAASWSGIVGLMAPLFAKAETMPPDAALRGEIAKIKAASPDPVARATAALALAQDRVRYVFLGMNDGGLVPADAETTWSRRFGDCKGKTALLLALLHGLGIDAHPVLVSSMLGDGLDARLPAVGLFNHVLVRATIGGRAYWLDGTRVGDRVLDGIETPAAHWGLPLVPGTTALVPMVPPPFAKPQTDVAIRIDASKGLTLPAPIHIERLVRGDEAINVNLALASLTGDARDQALRAFWKERYDFADPTAVTTSFDPAARELRMVLDGTTKMEWNDGWYQADHVWVGYRADFSRMAGPDRDAPYAVGYPSYTHVTETILLPPKSGTYTISKDADVDQTVAGIVYHRRARIEGDRFTVEQSDRSLAPEFPARDAAAAEETLRALSRKNVFVSRPDSYKATQADQDQLFATLPNTPEAALSKVEFLTSRDQDEDARRVLDQAVRDFPKSAAPLALRARMALYRDDEAAAKVDLDAAMAIDVHDFGVQIARAEYASRKGDREAALKLYSDALTMRPDELVALMGRAKAAAALHRDEQALQDSTRVLARDPAQSEMHLLRANLFRRKGDTVAVIAEADALAAAGPGDVEAQVTAAKIYAASGKQALALRAFDAAIAIRPEAYVYLNRFEVRPKTDVAGRQADLGAAYKLDPTQPDILRARAAFLGDRGDWRGAVAAFTALLATTTDNRGLLLGRGVAYAKAGDALLADRDFTAARSKAKDAEAFNNLCWTKATAGVALDRALAECDAGLAMAPDALDIRDSRAFVLLRLGRIDEAIAEYDRVLAKAPTMPASLYGRALAEARKGDSAAANRDAATARKLSDTVEERYKDYGMEMPSTARQSASVTK